MHVQVDVPGSQHGAFEDVRGLAELTPAPCGDDDPILDQHLLICEQGLPQQDMRGANQDRHPEILTAVPQFVKIDYILQP